MRLLSAIVGALLALAGARLGLRRRLPGFVFMTQPQQVILAQYRRLIERGNPHKRAIDLIALSTGTPPAIVAGYVESLTPLPARVEVPDYVPAEWSR